MDDNYTPFWLLGAVMILCTMILSLQIDSLIRKLETSIKIIIGG